MRVTPGSQLARPCPECERMMWAAHMVWSSAKHAWVCRLHATSLVRERFDWSEIDALCRQRSVLLDRNDLDRVDVVLRYSRN